MTIEEFTRRSRAGEITAERATEDCLARIEADNPRLNAFILVLGQAALQQAHTADLERASGIDRGPLHGAPISIKDLIDVEGAPTTAGSRVRDGHIAEKDAPVIDRLRAAGAVLIGKTNLHEFALGTTNEDSAFGPARNPLDPTRSPGGSSGGSAASVAAGMALASLGTDTGGSVRIPAAACGLVGLKPTLGEISTRGVVPLSTTMDHVGPLAQTVRDAALLYGVLAGGAQPLPDDSLDVRDLRLAFPRSYFYDLLDPDVRREFEEALERLRAGRARIKEIEIRHTEDIATAYTRIGLREAFQYHERTLETMPWKYTDRVRERLEAGRTVTNADYTAALKVRDELRREVDAALQGHDALVLPTLPIAAPLIGAETVQIDGVEQAVRPLTLRETQLFNMTGHPAIALPAGAMSGGLPASVQLVGARNETRALLRVALACESCVRGEIASSAGL